MRRNLHLWGVRSLILLGLYCLLPVAAPAQVSFVQITDPHVFDDVYQPKDSRSGDTGAVDNRPDDWAALASCVSEINRRVAADGMKYDFVAVTGGLGIEELSKVADEKARDDRIRQGARAFASIVALSKVNLWLFVPGNNDVLDEKPENIKYYHLFMEALRRAVKDMESGVEVKDLCPKDDSEVGQRYYARSDLVDINGYAFIGFNDSSFKNQEAKTDGSAASAGGEVKLLESQSDLQKRYVLQVDEMLNRSNIKYAYIFYHIPEIDDPYLVTLQPNQEPLRTRNASEGLIGPYTYSAWFVTKDVRGAWNKVLMNRKVMGLFAGHFHDNHRKTYQGFQWLRGQDYPPESISKLHVCPPLAMKLQGDDQARGFQEVYIDEEGKVSARLLWLDQAGWSLSGDTTETEAQSLKQLELGNEYEGGGKLLEAEAAFAKAAESDWPPTRKRALNSLRRMVGLQNSFLYKHLRTPVFSGWDAGVTALGTVLVTVALAAVLWAFSARPAKWYGDVTGKHKLRIGPIVGSPWWNTGDNFTQIMAMINGRIRGHFRRRIMLEGRPRLPMVVKSQSEEVGTLVEAVIPGGSGKLVAWLLKRTDRPKYSVEGIIQPNGRGKNAVFISLQESGLPLKTWSDVKNLDDFIADQKRLAFSILKYLVRYINR